MLSVYNIWTVARFEIKTLSRSWFLRIFASLALGVLTLLNLVFFTDVTGGFIPRMMYGISSSVPYMNMLFFNLAQAVITVFLASDFLKRDKKLDTTEAIYIRSMTNSDYVLGKSLGIFIIFFVLNLMLLIIAMIFNAASGMLQFNWSAYLLYPLLLSIPTLVFIIGLSFLVMTLLRNQAVTFIILLGYIATTLFYLGGKFYYVFDYTGFYVPLTYSDFIGFADLPPLFLLRGTYLFLGLSFIFLTMFTFKRLPQSAAMRKLVLGLSIVCFAGGIFTASTYVSNIGSGEELRAEMLELNTKYVSSEALSISKCDLNFIHEGESFSAVADLELVNRENVSVNSFIVRLNPGLKISSLEHAGSAVEFEREHHLVVVNPGVTINPGESYTMSIDYSGAIMDDAAYLDINEDARQRIFGIAFYNVGKKYSILTSNSVLLTPESMWYPQSGVTYTPAAQFATRKDFTEYKLTVQTSDGLRVISQGVVDSLGNGKFSFEPSQPLTQISLAIGDYKLESIQVDSVNYQLFTLKDHNYYKEYLSELSDTLGSVISELRTDFEREVGLTYPYKKLALVEAPIQFLKYKRLWTGAMESSQPQMIFLPENGVGIAEADFKQRSRMQERFGNRSNQVITARESQTGFFKGFVRSALLDQTESRGFRMGGQQNVNPDNVEKPYSVFPNFFNFVNHFENKDFPVFNRTFEEYLRIEQDNPRSSFMRNIFGLTPNEKAVEKLSGNPLSEIVKDTAFNTYLDDILKLKGQYLFTEIKYKAGAENLRGDIIKLLEANRYKSSGFDEFEKLLAAKYNLDLVALTKAWYEADKLPGFFVTGLNGYQIIDQNRERFQIKFNITNTTETGGFVDLTFNPARGRGFGGGFMRMMSGGFDDGTILEQTVFVDANQSKSFGFVLDESPGSMSFSTILSQNLPLEQSFPFEEFEEKNNARPFEGEIILNKVEEFIPSGEIIVDNEDDGFKINNPEQTSLLKELLGLGGDDEKYTGMRFWNPPDTWRFTINSEAYGKFVHSMAFTDNGTGDISVDWVAQVPSGGYYDIYVFVVKPRMRFRGRDNKVKQTFHYTIFSDDGEDEVNLDLQNAEKGWNLLGSYYLSEGETKVKMTNKVEDGMVTADAVKWVKK